MQCAAKAAEVCSTSSSSQQRDAAASLLADVGDAALAPLVWRHVLCQRSALTCDAGWPIVTATARLQLPACDTGVLDSLAGEALRNIATCAQKLLAPQQLPDLAALVQRIQPDLQLLHSLAQQGNLTDMAPGDVAALCALACALLQQRWAAADDSGTCPCDSAAYEHALQTLLALLLLLAQRSDAVSRQACARLIDSLVVEAIALLPADACSAVFWDILAHRARESPEATAVLLHHVHGTLRALPTPCALSATSHTGRSAQSTKTTVQLARCKGPALATCHGA